jgi:hypothetical protein
MLLSNRLAASADVSRLPLRKVEAALRKTTEVLATQLASPSDARPDWTDFEWRVAQAVAAIHGVSPLLSSVLRWQGPESWECFLVEQREHTLKRHQRIAGLLAEIDSQARREGIAIVPLKGAALHELGIYTAGERPMSDIDLLVSSADEEASTRLLGALRYHVTLANWRHRVFEPDATINPVGFGEHCANSIKIELHTQIMERLPMVDRDISDLVFPRHPQPGLNRYPSTAALMSHLLLHAAGNMRLRGLRLLHLHDVALLAQQMNSSDWEAAFCDARGQPTWWASPLLTLMARYYPVAVPQQIVARAECACPWLLSRICRRQSLCDVSLSSLWIRAFPGIEWSGSATEMYRYIVSRLVPDRELLAARREIARTHPGAAQSRWSHLSQGQRIVRWLCSRPPRMETLSSVRSALAQLSTQPRTVHSTAVSLRYKS